MKLYNKSGNGLQHVLIEEVKRGDEVIKAPKTYTLPNGGTADIPEEIAEKWLKFPGVEKYIAQADIEEVQAKADEEKAQLEAENAELKAELEALKTAQAKADEEKALEAAKAEAEALGISFSANIGLAKLQEKIAAKKAEQ